MLAEQRWRRAAAPLNAPDIALQKMAADFTASHSLA
jgi:hypothetical protein